jgi:hypothetical protein
VTWPRPRRWWTPSPRTKLMDNAATVGGHLRSRLERLRREATRRWVEVRGMGLMQGVELVKDKASREPAPTVAAAVMEAAKDRGLIIGKGRPLRERAPDLARPERHDAGTRTRPRTSWTRRSWRAARHEQCSAPAASGRGGWCRFLRARRAPIPRGGPRWIAGAFPTSSASEPVVFTDTADFHAPHRQRRHPAFSDDLRPLRGAGRTRSWPGQAATWSRSRPTACCIRYDDAKAALRGRGRDGVPALTD